MAATTKATARKGSPNAKAAAKKVVNQTPKKAAVKKTAVSPKKAKAAAKKAPAKKAPAKATAKKSSPAAKKAAAKKATPAAKKAPAKAAAKPATKQVASPPKLPAAAGGGQIAKKAPPKRKGPLDKFLLGQVDALKEERETYTRQAVSLKAEADMLMAEREPGDVQFDEESGEGDTLAVERERDLALSAQAQAAVEEIDLALEKIKEGTYGVCEQCHNTIPKERLRALPYAALCVQCKSAGFTRR
jgi:RNA polymerase-binding transcription factor DksA